MYRSVIIVLLPFISYGLAVNVNETDKDIQCRKSSSVNASRTYAGNCFRSVVRAHLNLDEENRNCSNVNDMEKSLSEHINTVKKQCLPSLITDNHMILELMNFSLSNDRFKDFHSDAKCVENQKPNITSCINGVVGSSNKTHSKHSSWVDKSLLTFGNWSCEKTNELKICVDTALSVCKPKTWEFVASLFNITISHCNDLSSNNTVNKVLQSNTKSIGVILGISAAVVILGAVIIIIVKMKNK